MSLRAVALLAVLALLAIAPLAGAQGAPPPATQAAELRLTGSGGDATLEFPFQLARDGSVYAKLLPTPWNPILPSGAPNGSVAQDRSAGLHGWFVHLQVVPAQGPGQASLVDLGYFADSGASQSVALPGGAQHVLRATIHAPASAGGVGQTYRVDLALAHEDGAQGSTDATWGMAAALTIAQASGPSLEGPAMLAVLAVAGLVAVGAAVVAALRWRARQPQDWL
jgi:hypothetical protein